jgi:mannitol/fructose-specific phosphotransferase system IIA component (Ntr-type)
MTNNLIAKTLYKTVILKCQDRNEALDQLLSHILRSKNVGNPQQVTRMIKDREEEMTSGIGSGIAIPHLRHPDIAEVTVVFGLSKNGISWVSPDYGPVHYVCMIFSPNDDPDHYLEVIGDYLSKLRSEKVRNKLLKATTMTELRNIWTGQVAKSSQK